MKPKFTTGPDDAGPSRGDQAETFEELMARVTAELCGAAPFGGLIPYRFPEPSPPSRQWIGPDPPSDLGR